MLLGPIDVDDDLASVDCDGNLIPLLKRGMGGILFRAYL